MYVSRLDRPWLETPFLFQGFHIESPEVIQELRRYCEYVYVDVERSDRTITLPAGAPPKPTRDQQVRRPTDGQESSPVQAGTLTAAETRDDTAVLKAELPIAKKAHDETAEIIDKLFSRIRLGETPEITGIQQTLDPMIDSIMRNEDAMSWLARMKTKDNYVYDHSMASSVWAMIFGKHLGIRKDDLRVLAMGAVFMDVGKTRIPTELLVKQESLDAEEMALMKNHASFGVEIVSKIKLLDPRVIEMVECHHERYNGTGYPRGLKGADIPIFARIAGIIDTYDAMTTPRAYAEPVSTYAAIRELNKLAGVEFPAEVVEQFVQAVGVFPVGTLVELNTGEVGVVIAQNPVRRLRPKVMLILDRDKEKLRQFPTVDLRNQLADSDCESSLWIEQGLAPGAYDIDPGEYYL